MRTSILQVLLSMRMPADMECDILTDLLKRGLLWVFSVGKNNQ